MKNSNAFSFELPTRIEFAEGALDRLGDVARELGARRVLIVTDPGLAALDLIPRAVSLLAAVGVAAAVLSAVQANPKDSDVEAGAAAAVEFKADCLVAIGGGSPIDCAKAMAVLATRGGKARLYEDRSRIGTGLMPLVAVPTTSGTGSEVTFGAVITDTQARFKFTIKSRQTAPRVALVDPLLTVSMPRSLTAATGMDALTHAVEAYTALAAEPIADACALHAAGLIAGSLARAVENGRDLPARSDMLLGSLIAGLAFSHSDVAAVHCIAEALGGMYDLPHGVCNAVCLPVVMDYNMEYCAERYARLGRAMQVAAAGAAGAREGARATVAFVKDLARKVGLPAFSGFNIPPADFPLIAEKSAANGSNIDNPRPMAAADYLEVLRRLQADG